MQTISKKQLWLIVIGISIAGFIFGEMYRSSLEIFNHRYTKTQQYAESIKLKIGNSYLISVYGSDDEMGLQKWAQLDFGFYAEDDYGNEVIRKNITASESQENGGVKRAVNGFEFDYLPKQSRELILHLNFIRGDDVDIKVYENISELANITPGLFILLLVVAVIFFFKARNVAKSN